MFMYVLKHVPEDFVVEEIAHLALKERGSHLVVRVQKRERNTEEVASLLAQRLGIDRRDVGYAGAKDRNAITTQHFSLKGVSSERVNAVSLSNVTIEPLGFLDVPLGLGVLEGNKFTITLRNLEGDEDFSLPASIPNYFDEQRFGTNNTAIGRAIVKKEWHKAVEEIRASGSHDARVFEERLSDHPTDAVGAIIALPRQLLRMYLHAYQSSLWNRALARHVSQATSRTKTWSYSNGELVFPEKEVTVDAAAIPIPGFDAATLQSPIMAAILKEEGLTPRDFVIRQLPNLSLEGTERNALVAVKEYSFSAFEDDDAFPETKKIVLSFTLPKGCYATIVVKATLA